MSKKKKRLDKKLIAERLRELEAEAKSSTPKSALKSEAKTEEPKNRVQTEKKTDETEKNFEEETNNTDTTIIRDMKKVAILTSVIIIIFIALYLTNLKTNYILTASNKIFNILHVGQL